MYVYAHCRCLLAHDALPIRHSCHPLQRTPFHRKLSRPSHSFAALWPSRSPLVYQEGSSTRATLAKSNHSARRASSSPACSPPLAAFASHLPHQPRRGRVWHSLPPPRQRSRRRPRGCPCNGVVWQPRPHHRPPSPLREPRPTQPLMQSPVPRAPTHPLGSFPAPRRPLPPARRLGHSW